MVSLRHERIENWILVTGVIRSGTTFAGKVLSLPLSVDYLHEPYNGGYLRGTDERLKAPYIRVGDASEEGEQFRQWARAILSYEIDLRTYRHRSDSPFRDRLKRTLGSRGPFYLRLARYNPFHRATVIKDPYAKLVAAPLYAEFGVRPVITIRHPVSLVGSLQRINWWPKMRIFKGVPKLAEDYFGGDDTLFTKKWTDPVAEAATHWMVAHKILLSQARKYGDWVVVTHEALSANPEREFRELYRTLNLPWTSRIGSKVRSLTKGSAEASGGRVMDLKRDSGAIFELRKAAVSKGDREKIYEIVKDVALDVYPVESFGLDD